MKLALADELCRKVFLNLIFMDFHYLCMLGAVLQLRVSVFVSASDCSDCRF